MSIEPRRPEVYSFSTHYTWRRWVAARFWIFRGGDGKELGIGILALPVTAQIKSVGLLAQDSWPPNFSAVIASQYVKTVLISHALLDPETNFIR